MENYNDDLNKNLQNIQEIQQHVVGNVNAQNENNEKEIKTSSANNNNNNNNINTITFSNDNDNNNINIITSSDVKKGVTKDEFFGGIDNAIGKFIYGDGFVEKNKGIKNFEELNNYFKLLKLLTDSRILQIVNILLKDRAKPYGRKFYLGPQNSRVDYSGTGRIYKMISSSFKTIKDLKDAYLIRCREFEKIYLRDKSKITYTNYCLFKELLVTKLFKEFCELQYLLEQINILNNESIDPFYVGEYLGKICDALEKLEGIYNEDDLNQVTKKNL